MSVVGKSHKHDYPWDYTLGMPGSPLETGQVWECEGCHERFRVSVSNDKGWPTGVFGRIQANPTRWFYEWKPYKGKVEPL